MNRVRVGVDSALPENVNAGLEIVINGLDRPAVETSLRAGIHAGHRSGVVAVTAENCGGKLGKHHFDLSELIPASDASEGN